MRKNKVLLLIGILWLIIIVGFITTKEFTLRTGEQILLKTVPVDPRDLFRGDYVILRYEISTLNLNKVPSDYLYFESRDKVYVALQKENGYGVPLKIYKNNPAKKILFIKGIVKDIHEKELLVEYGIESYFVPEGKGKEIEKIIRDKKLDAKVLIDRFGNAAIKTLLMDDKEIRLGQAEE